jgi:DNA-binding LytR/AlgR family response regulator
LYIKAEDHYLELITTNKKEFVRGKISEIILELPPNFVKCHRSYIINKNQIKSFFKTEIVMQNNDTVPISRSFKFSGNF